ncbi:MAG: hypothetical protein M3004_08165 [Bacteroidota bacterium]|nr:hypothetical protein [Bacteroidota bacterium]
MNLVSKNLVPYLFLLILILGSNINANAQKYKVGQRVEVDINGNGQWVKATIKEANFNPYINGDYLVRLDAPDAIGGIEYTFTSAHFNQIRLPGNKTNSITSNCIFGPPPGTFTNNSSASNPLFKKIFYDKVNTVANGTINAPIRIGITYLSFDVSKPYRNDVSTKSVPLNGIIYPATIKYIICEDYNPGIKRKMVETQFEFFIDRFGKWNGAPKGYEDKITILE